MLLVPIFTDVGQILLQPTPSSVWRGASKRMRRPRSARIGGNTREGGGQLGVGAAPPRQQGARPPSQSFSLLARKVQRPQSWRRVTPAFATFTTCCSGSPPTCCQAKHTREHVARQNTHEATFSKIQGRVLTIKHWDFAGDGLFGIARKHPEDLPVGTFFARVVTRGCYQGQGEEPGRWWQSPFHPKSDFLGKIEKRSLFHG